MFYQSSFHINTRQIRCLIIIDRNKVIEVTTLFHLGDRSQYYDCNRFINWAPGVEVDDLVEDVSQLRVVQVPERVDQ